ncbi:MAG: S-layer homology domain-containing protein [Vulcanimicrobiaceae bacterium]
MRQRFLIAAFAVGSAMCTACSSGGSSQSAASSPSPTASTPLANTTTALPVSAASAPVAIATATAAVASPTSVAFTDIAGNFAETAITQEAALGVFGTAGGAFKPDDPISRGQYVAWLVTANNLYFKDTPAAQIRLAASNADQTFVDVPKSHPFFPQIEGMADAGYVIGVDKTHFAPDRPLTREELVAIQTSRYSNGASFAAITSPQGMYCVRLADANAISKPYWGAFNYDQCTGFNGLDDLHRIFGSVKTLHPQRPATRAEVAVALQKVAGRTAGNVAR